jgi:hypothetical protein
VRRLFTFGFGQTDPLTGESLANCYVWVEADDREAARRIMLDRFGRAETGGNWAFDYPDEDAAGVHRYGMREITLEVPA